MCTLENVFGACFDCIAECCCVCLWCASGIMRYSVCCSLLQSVAVCCSLLQSVAVWWCICVVCIWYIEVSILMQCVAMSCSVLQRVGVCL